MHQFCNGSYGKTQGDGVKVDNCKGNEINKKCKHLQKGMVVCCG